MAIHWSDFALQSLEEIITYYEFEVSLALVIEDVGKHAHGVQVDAVVEFVGLLDRWVEEGFG